MPGNQERAHGPDRHSATNTPRTRQGLRAAKAASGKSGPHRAMAWFREIGLVVLAAVVLSFLIKTFFFRAFFIPSFSMADTLKVDDRIIVNLLIPEPFGLARGDVIVFRDTKNWLPETSPGPDRGLGGVVEDSLGFVGLLPEKSGNYLVKRAIGLPGDRVTCCTAAGQITVNGAALNETYLNAAEPAWVQPFDVVVPPGKLWVMGDNRNYSADSRAHRGTDGGFVDLSDVEGKASVIAWPPNRTGPVDNYPGVFAGVPAPRTAG